MAAERGVHPLDEVRADLVAEASGTRVDEGGHRSLPQTECLGRVGVEDAVDPLQLEEVVSGAQRA